MVADELEVARQASGEAHRLGTRDALAYFHPGMIELRLGMAAQARADLTKAFRTNRYFSVLHQQDAKRALVSLGHA